MALGGVGGWVEGEEEESSSSPSSPVLCLFCLRWVGGCGWVVRGGGWVDEWGGGEENEEVDLSWASREWVGGWVGG